MNARTILGTIRHNDPSQGRVTLLAGPDGCVWAQPDGVDGSGEYRGPVPTNIPIGFENTAWGAPAWDFWPGLSIRCPACDELVEPQPIDGPGFGMRCPGCGSTL